MSQCQVQQVVLYMLAVPPFSWRTQALEDFRSKYSFRRTVDGRLQLRSARGEWYQCRLDMEVPGSMLLRDSKGNVYALQTEVLQQVSSAGRLQDAGWTQPIPARTHLAGSPNS